MSIGSIRRSSALVGTAAVAFALTIGLQQGASAVPAGDSIDLDLGTPGSVANSTVGAAGLPGWALPTGTSIDAEVTAGAAFRISNGLMGPFFSHAGFVTPALGQTAGEDGIGDVNTFDASFTVASATGGYQEGLNIGVAFDDAAQTWSRSGGNIYFVHEGDVLKVVTFWLDEADNQEPRPVDSAGLVWTEKVIAELDPAGSYDVRAVVSFVDGPGNDTIDFYIDGALVASSGTFDGFNAVKSFTPLPVGTLSFASGSNTKSVNGIPLIGSAGKVPALVGGGLLFSDVHYRSYDVVPVPTEPTVVDPTPSATPDAPLALPASATGGEPIEVTASGFDPYENVEFTWYSTPLFAGWAQADAYGNVRATFTVPSTLASGTTHTLQGVGARSNRVVNSQTTIALAATGVEGISPVAWIAGGSLLVLGIAAVVVAGARSRGKARRDHTS